MPGRNCGNCQYCGKVKNFKSCAKLAHRIITMKGRFPVGDRPFSSHISANSLRLGHMTGSSTLHSINSPLAILPFFRTKYPAPRQKQDWLGFCVDQHFRCLLAMPDGNLLQNMKGVFHPSFVTPQQVNARQLNIKGFSNATNKDVPRIPCGTFFQKIHNCGAHQK